MERNIEEIKSYYAAMEDDILENIARTDMDSLDEEVQAVVTEEMNKRNLTFVAPRTAAVNQEKLASYIETLRSQQNLSGAIAAGIAGSVIGAVLWAAITVATQYQIGYMAIAVGFLVGFMVRYFGRGLDNIYGIIGAGFALLGCVLGNFFSIIGFVAASEGLGYMETLNLIDYSLVPQIMLESFNPMDILFYGFALYEGFRFSFRQITEEEIAENAMNE